MGIADNARSVMADSQELRKRELVSKFRRWEQLYRRAICELLRLVNRIDLAVKTPEHLEIKGISEMYQQKEIYEYHLSIINGNDDHLKFELYKEVMKCK